MKNLLPYDYPYKWIEHEKRHYNEIYVLAAYIIGGAMGDSIELPLAFLYERPECKEIFNPIWGDGAPLANIHRNGVFFWMKKA